MSDIKIPKYLIEDSRRRLIWMSADIENAKSALRTSQAEAQEHQDRIDRLEMERAEITAFLAQVGDEDGE